MKPLTLFTRQMNDFAEKLCELYPADGNLRTYREAISLVSSGTPREVMRYFHEYVNKPYAGHIAARDASFFLSNDWSKVVDSSELSVVPTLKKYWSEMTPATHNSIWEYLSLLCRLTDMFLATGESL